MARTHADAPEERVRMERAARAFVRHVDAIDADAGARFDTLSLCAERERCLRAEGVRDPFARTKASENEAALALLPELLRELDALPAEKLVPALVRGIFAGNVFDLGSHATAALFDAGETGFRAVRERLRARPWRVDDLDAFGRRFERGVGCALLFVDNAGSDVVLGMLPFARALLARGGRVILSANETPALNDVTHAELGPLVDAAASGDGTLAEALRSGRLVLASSGNAIPLLDLRHLGPDLLRAIGEWPPDLVVLEGMGRAVESNWHARLRVDTLKIAMLKDVSVAAALGGELYDLVCRYEPAREASLG